MKYYNTKRIDAKKATYNVIFGERSNGKTYALLKKAIQNKHKGLGQFAYVRRWKEDIKASRASTVFNGHVTNGEVTKLTNGEYEGVHYSVGRFYLCNYSEDGKPIYNESDCLGYVFAISDGEHIKSTAYPEISLIVFDEFLTKHTYLPDEFVLFMNVVSTIIRKRDNVSIYMLGNTVSKHCPYFDEMGLNKVKSMKQGTIDVYRYGSSELIVAVEYCASTQKENGGKVNKYFAFDNPKLEMITGGAWELDIYPHLPVKYKPKEVQLSFYISFDGENYQGDVVFKGDGYFIFYHRKTTPLKENETDLIYSLDHRYEYNYCRNFLKPSNRLGCKVLEIMKQYKSYFQDNQVGNNLSNYFKTCKGF